MYVLLLFMLYDGDDSDDRNRDALDLLIGIGVDLAHRLKAEIASPADQRERSQSELTLDYARLNQALRQAIALDEAIVRERKRIAFRREQDEWREEALAGREQRKDDLRCVIEPMIGPARSRTYDLRLDAFLDREARQILRSPGDFGHAIGRIVHQMRLEPDWSRWEDEPWLEDAKATYDALARTPIIEFANFDHIEEYVPPPDSG